MAKIKSQNSFKFTPERVIEHNRFLDFLTDKEELQIDSVKDYVETLYTKANDFYNTDFSAENKHLKKDLEISKSESAHWAAVVEEQSQKIQDQNNKVQDQPAEFNPEAMDHFNSYYAAYLVCDPEANKSQALNDLITGIKTFSKVSGFKPQIKGKDLPSF